MPATKDLVILDSSKMVKTIFAGLLEGYKGIERIHYPKDAYDALDLVEKLDSYVVTLDVENDLIDGMYFLERLMKSKPAPIILVSSKSNKAVEKSLKALDMGAVSCIERPCDLAGFRDLDTVRTHLQEAIYSAANTQFYQFEFDMQVENFTSTPKSKKGIVALGAHEGGVHAIKQIIAKMPKSGPAVLISQSLPPGYAEQFAGMLNNISEMKVAVAKNHDFVEPGRAYVAPTGFNMGVVLNTKGERVIYLEEIQPHDKDNHAIDYLFNSAAKICAEDCVGVVLTGIGHDGTIGAEKLKGAGGLVLAQMAKTCIYPDMVTSVVDSGSASKECSLTALPAAILDKLR